MKFSAASVLALAATALAAPAPTPGGHGNNKCGRPYCTDLLDVVIDVDLDVCLRVDLLGLLHIGLDLDVDLDVDLALKTCKSHGGHKVYCCPSKCERGQHIPKQCRERY